MTEDPRAAGLADILEQVREDAAVLKAAIDASRAIGRPVAVLPEDEVQRHIHLLLDAIAAVLRGAPAQIQSAITAADELAADRARQGVSLELLLAGIHSARTVILKAIIDAAQTVMSAEEVLSLLTQLDNAASIRMNSMIVSYQRAERDLKRTRWQTQVQALRELLAGGPISWAPEAGLDPSAAYHCVAVNVSTPSEARALGPLLEVNEQVSGIVHGYLCVITNRLPNTERLGDVLFVVSPLVSVSQLASTYGLCRDAIRAYRLQGRTGVQSLVGAALYVGTAVRPALGQILSAELLQKLDPDDEFHRLIAATALTYITEGTRTEPTAAALHVHPNTVKYRMRRFFELVGFAEESDSFARTLPQSVTWWWALSAWLTAVEAPAEPR